MKDRTELLAAVALAQADVTFLRQKGDELIKLVKAHCDACDEQLGKLSKLADEVVESAEPDDPADSWKDAPPEDGE